MIKGAQGQRVKAMTGEEFEKRLKQLMEEIVKGLLYYAAWVSLHWHDDEVSWSRDEQNQAVGRFGDFLTPVATALNGMALMQFAKALDEDSRTVSITTLLDAAQQEPSLVPNATPADLAAISKQLQQSDRTIAKLRRVRNKKLAHAEASPQQVDGLMKGNFDRLVDDIKSAFDKLSVGRGDPRIAWDIPVQLVEWQGREVMRLLVKEARGSP